MPKRKGGNPSPPPLSEVEKRKMKIEAEKQAALKDMTTALNANPVMSIVEVYAITRETDGEGKEIEKSQMVQKTVEIIPRKSALVEFSTDSKGNIKPRVKIYHENSDTALETSARIMENALREARRLSLILQE